MRTVEMARRFKSMRQQTFAEESFEKFRKQTRKEQFLDEMERIIPWQELTAAIEP
jgi:IS5 family transposase